MVREGTTYYLYEDNIGSVSYIQHMGDEMTIVNSARVSFDAHKEGEMDERDKKLVKYLWSHRHTSPFEHCSITFRFVVPLFVARQHHRHRVWSFNEISRRYTSENLEFYIPLVLRRQHKNDRQASDMGAFDPIVVDDLGHPKRASVLLGEHTKDCVDVYERMLDAGVSREMARMVLPQNMYTKYYGTVNLNNLFKFIDIRLDKHAQWEIQEVAKACLYLARDVWPKVVGPILTDKLVTFQESAKESPE